MNLLELSLHSFRNYSKASFSFEPEAIHVFIGDNAQGKTNILEAIYYLSHLRSFRTNKQASLIEHNQESALLDGKVESKGRRVSLKAQLGPGKKQWIFGNETKSAGFLGQLNAILFSPDDLSLFSGSPKERRAFVDLELVKLSRSYTGTLVNYQKLLSQRNQALKAQRVDAVLLDILAEQMIEMQSILIHQRKAFLSRLETLSNQIFSQFGLNEVLTIHYKGPVTVENETEEKEIKEALKKAYAASKEKERRLKSTQVGIHRDDVEFLLNNHPIAQSASQGQKRSVLFAIKLGLAEMIKEKSGQYPVLLLDDVFSELDVYRKRQLISLLPAGMQIFITSAEPLKPNWFDRTSRFYSVKEGVVKEGIA